MPLQVPGSAVSVSPATAEPLIDAATEFAGAAGAAIVDLGLSEAEKAAGPGKEEAGKEEDAHAR